MRLDKAAVVARIREVGAVAILRTQTSDQALRAAEAVIAGGFRIVEVTYGVPDTANVIAQLVRENSSDLLVGAGTVLTRDQSYAAIDAGAQFLVSPCVIPEMIEAGRERDIATIPGAFTPTEIYTAWSLGADIIKLFPAVSNGPEYLRTLRGPLPHIPIMPTSGVNISNVADWFRAGAVAVGAVSSVIDPALIQTGDWDALTERSREFLDAVQRARESR
ncbi:MAG TPA: bifunctional 4-hydroxy-2-oxoglutarate aldolase/2-dehydro-3-deoxy-phosphogluconate aldolase [Chthoniobacterales bacterium]|nr:bifunctional 4-hydroxy-2-oxoglutarate aldolase/2-dehydro-3-deoxy-phosphogluconate aldolase [Chthoniobacterales bacterium]